MSIPFCSVMSVDHFDGLESRSGVNFPVRIGDTRVALNVRAMR